MQVNYRRAPQCRGRWSVRAKSSHAAAALLYDESPNTDRMKRLNHARWPGNILRCASYSAHPPQRIERRTPKNVNGGLNHETYTSKTAAPSSASLDCGLGSSAVLRCPCAGRSAIPRGRLWRSAHGTGNLPLLKPNAFIRRGPETYLSRQSLKTTTRNSSQGPMTRACSTPRGRGNGRDLVPDIGAPNRPPLDGREITTKPALISALQKAHGWPRPPMSDHSLLHPKCRQAGCRAPARCGLQARCDKWGVRPPLLNHRPANGVSWTSGDKHRTFGRLLAKGRDAWTRPRSLRKTTQNIRC